MRSLHGMKTWGSYRRVDCIFTSPHAVKICYSFVPESCQPYDGSDERCRMECYDEKIYRAKNYRWLRMNVSNLFLLLTAQIIWRGLGKCRISWYSEQLVWAELSNTYSQRSHNPQSQRNRAIFQLGTSAGIMAIAMSRPWWWSFRMAQ